jgi:predicted kinase
LNLPAAPALVVLGGLPGVGKSTIARALLRQWPAVYLRIDTIEQALRDGGALGGSGVGAAGYVVAYALARTHLSQGLPVLADCVNPWAETRASWRRVALDAQAPMLAVEVVCGDPAEHRRRVEQRVSDVPGLVPPLWDAVCRHDYVPWAADSNPLVVETARRSPGEAATHVLAALRERAAG